MGLLRIGDQAALDAVDEELRRAVEALRTTDDRSAERPLLRRHIDKLLERRLVLRDRLLMQTYEESLTA